MNDDTLLDGAGRAARDAARRDPLDEKWDRLSDGSLSAAERRALLESCGDERLAERAEIAFRPFDDDDRADFVAAALAARTTSSLPAGSADDGNGPDESDVPAADEAPAGTAERTDAAQPGSDIDRSADSHGRGGSNVVPLRPRVPRAAWVFGLAASAVLAVGVVLSSGVFGPRDGGALPGYGYELRGTAEVRSATSLSVRADQAFEVILTPDTALTSPADVRLFVADGDRLRRLETLSLEVAPSGAARVSAAASALPLGDVEIVAIISRGAWPQRLAPGERSDDWQAVRIPLTVLPASQ
jgi:hypothetical protein